MKLKSVDNIVYRKSIHNTMTQQRNRKLKSVHKQIDSVYNPIIISIYDNVDTLTEFTVDDNVTVETDFVYEEIVRKIENEIEVS